MKNIFSVDFEDWYHSNLSSSPKNLPLNKTSIINKGTDKILNLLKITKNKATFFILGELTKNYKNLIKEIISEGHEIALHSFSHDLIYQLGPKRFEENLIRAKNDLENIINKKILGFRAPSWSVDFNNTPWFWKILNKHGFKYSSSIIPFKTKIYGEPRSERFFYKINNIIEFPVSTFKILSFNIPFSGGFYLRFLPFNLIKLFTKIINNSKKYVIFYIHPRELIKNQPKIKLSFFDSLIHYYGIGSVEKKLNCLLNSNSFITFEQFIKLYIKS